MCRFGRVGFNVDWTVCVLKRIPYWALCVTIGSLLGNDLQPLDDCHISSLKPYKTHNPITLISLHLQPSPPPSLKNTKINPLTTSKSLRPFILHLLNLPHSKPVTMSSSKSISNPNEPFVPKYPMPEGFELKGVPVTRRQWDDMVARFPHTYMPLVEEELLRRRKEEATALRYITGLQKFGVQIN